MSPEARKEPLSRARIEFERWARREWPTCPPPAGAWVAWAKAWELRNTAMRGLLRRALRPVTPADGEGWIEHDGKGDAPLANPWIEVRFNDGDTAVGRAYDWDQNWEWGPNGPEHPGTIVAYRRIPLRYRVADAA
jgi:hypothetical protein